MQMGNPKDCEKKIKAKPIAPLVWPGQRTRGLHNFVKGLNYRSDRTKLLLRAISNSWRRCLFRLQTLQLQLNYTRRKRRRWNFNFSSCTLSPAGGGRIIELQKYSD